MADQQPACVFCSIISGSVPGHIVLDAPEVVGFLDARPVFKGHVLVVPRPHLATLVDLDDSMAASLFGAARRVALALEAALDADGAFVGLNNRISQSVAHVHVHVVPRRSKDGLRGFFWPRTRYTDEDEAAGYAGRIRAALGSQG
ncbi:MAG TPA: HIT domain-containing protein [Acidimicrobiales bacterium]|nr:HIT domain-containing protein [Acidimicrobiales bacterium]